MRFIAYAAAGWLAASPDSWCARSLACCRVTFRRTSTLSCGCGSTVALPTLLVARPEFDGIVAAGCAALAEALDGDVSLLTVGDSAPPGRIGGRTMLPIERPVESPAAVCASC